MSPQGNWTDYCIGVAQELLALGFAIKPAKLEIHSTVPSGSGLSSSAALEVSTALALLDGRPIETIELARLCQRAERNFVGMPCGIMDQYVSVFGARTPPSASTAAPSTHEVVPLPDGVEIVAVNSMVKHELGKSEYPLRVAAVRGGALALPRQGRPARRHAWATWSARAAEIPEVPPGRAPATSSPRTSASTSSSKPPPRRRPARMGQLFVESHRCLQHDYEVSCAELDFLVDTALTVDGVYGARMTGGGFGGCTVNLVDAGAVANFDLAVNSAYQAKFGKTPTVYRCNPSAGAGPCNESASSSR